MSVYDKSLEQIQGSYNFTDLEMAKMDYTLKVFAYEFSKLIFFFTSPCSIIPFEKKPDILFSSDLIVY